MLKKVTQFYRPRTVEEACQLLLARDGKNVLLAGGTNLGVIEDANIEGLIDMKGLNLSYIQRMAYGYAIGAGTPIQDIMKSPILSGPSGNLLKNAAGSIGSTLLRHSITAGGNVITAFPWSDLPPALLALDATVVLRNGSHERVLTVEKLFETHPRDILKSNEILTEIRIPEFKVGTGTAFSKFAKTKNDYSMVTIAVRLTKRGAAVSEARIAVNGVSRKPMRCLAAEKALLNQKWSPEIREKAMKASLDGLVFTADFRASKEYRSEITPILIGRCLDEAISKA